MVWGQGAYAIWSHPLFSICRGLYRMLEEPWILGGLAFLYGFFSSFFRPEIERSTNTALIEYLQREQIYRILHRNRLSS